jgi:hypothetical protein
LIDNVRSPLLDLGFRRCQVVHAAAAPGEYHRCATRITIGIEMQFAGSGVVENLVIAIDFVKMGGYPFDTRHDLDASAPLAAYEGGTARRFRLG